MHRLRSVLPFLLLVGLTFAAYWNAWPDVLVHDDRLLAGEKPFADLERVPEFFKESVGTSTHFKGFDTDNFYRPLLLVSFAIDATVFPRDAAAWHLVNVSLHVLVTLLVYLLALQLLRLGDPESDSAWLLALFAAMVFGVHPIHAEVVNSIFNRSTLLVAVGTAAGLWWLMRFLEPRPVLAWAGIWLAYWFVLFSRETGIVLPALAVVMVWIYTTGGWWQKARRCLPALTLLVPLAVYLGMRARALAPLASGGDETAGLAGQAGLLPTLGQLEWSALLKLAGVWFDALRLTLWPHPLLMHHSTSGPTVAIIGLIVQVGLITGAYFMYRRNRPGMLAGLTIFYVLLLPSSRLFGSGGTSPHLAERYLYEPSIGLALVLAFGLCWVMRRGDRLLTSAPVVLAVCLLTPLTWARNAQWTDDVTLFEHDYGHGARGNKSLQTLTVALMNEGNFARVAEVCRDIAGLPYLSGFVRLNCGTAYARSGDRQAAEQAFLDATRDETSRVHALASLSFLYVAQGRRDEARDRLEAAIRTERNPATSAYLSGLLLTRLYPDDEARLLEARSHFEDALSRQPGFALARMALDKVNRDLESVQ